MAVQGARRSRGHAIKRYVFGRLSAYPPIDFTLSIRDTPRARDSQMQSYFLDLSHYGAAWIAGPAAWFGGATLDPASLAKLALVVVLPLALLVQRPLGRVEMVGATAAIFLLYLLNSFYYYQICDETFIAPRMAKVWLSGGGLSMSVGAKQDGTAEMAFLLLLCGLGKLGIEPVYAAIVLSFLLGALFLGVISRFAACITGNERVGLAIGACAALSSWIARPALSGFSVFLFASGLLICLQLFWEKRFLSAYFIAGMLPWVRNEGVILCLLLPVVQLLAEGRAAIDWWRARGGPAAALLFLPVVVFHLFWLLYYGHLTPSPGQFKGSALAIPALVKARFVRELKVLAIDAVLRLPVLYTALLALLVRRPTRIQWLTFAALGLFTLPYIAGGGDYLGYQRYYVPQVGLLFVISALLLEWGRAQLSHRAPRLANLLVGAVIVAGTAQVSIARPNPYPWAAKKTNYYKMFGSTLKQIAPPDWKIAQVEIATIPYYSEHHLVDMFGITNPRFRRVQADDFPGVGIKADPTIIDEVRPEMIVVSTLELIPSPRELEAQQVFPPFVEENLNFLPVPKAPAGWLDLYLSNGHVQELGTFLRRTYGGIDKLARDYDLLLMRHPYYGVSLSFIRRDKLGELMEFNRHKAWFPPLVAFAYSVDRLR